MNKELTKLKNKIRNIENITEEIFMNIDDEKHIIHLLKKLEDNNKNNEVEINLNPNEAKIKLKPIGIMYLFEMHKWLNAHGFYPCEIETIEGKFELFYIKKIKLKNRSKQKLVDRSKMPIIFGNQIGGGVSKITGTRNVSRTFF